MKSEPRRAQRAGGLRPARELDDDSGTPGAMLRAAAAAVRAAWRNERGDALDADEAAGILDWLVTAVQHALWGGVPSRGGPASAPLGRHLLELLRAELIVRWRAAEPPPPDLILAVLDAVEGVREAVDPDWSQHLVSRLSGPEGLDLVVGVAHDIRSPLTSVLFLSETLGRGDGGANLTDLQRRQLRLIYGAALGLSNLASDIIELARGGELLVEQDTEPFSLSDLLETLHDIVRPVAEEKGLDIRYSVTTSDRRLGWPLALSRVLLNLTTNALKFTDEGFVEIGTSAKGLSRVEFSVRDSGRGISKEAIDSLYLPFRRSRSRKGPGGYHFSGTGLGLAMCRKLLGAMGSELHYESWPGAGTRFYFTLDLPPASPL